MFILKTYSQTIGSGRDDYKFDEDSLSFDSIDDLKLYVSANVMAAKQRFYDPANYEFMENGGGCDISTESNKLILSTYDNMYPEQLLDVYEPVDEYDSPIYVDFSDIVKSFNEYNLDEQKSVENDIAQSNKTLDRIAAAESVSKPVYENLSVEQAAKMSDKEFCDVYDDYMMQHD